LSTADVAAATRHAIEQHFSAADIAAATVVKIVAVAAAVMPHLIMR
jgi:hypothetical protein